MSASFPCRYCICLSDLLFSYYRQCILTPLASYWKILFSLCNASSWSIFYFKEKISSAFSLFCLSSCYCPWYMLFRKWLT